MLGLIIGELCSYVGMHDIYSSDAAILSSVRKPSDFFTDLSLACLYSSIQYGAKTPESRHA